LDCVALGVGGGIQSLGGIVAKGRDFLQWLFNRGKVSAPSTTFLPPTRPPRPFLISVRGGDGGPGQDGMEFDQEVKARGGKGGRAGWGGTVEISTKDTPWRKYLVIDVSPGTPGRGRKGGRYHWQGVLRSGPEGAAGQEGQAGQVMTSVEP